MKLVIDIPEKLYKATRNGLDAVEIWDLRMAVKNGTPLPKGHGRLIDEQDAIKMAINALEQEPFINKPCVSENVCEHDKQMVLDKIRAEIDEQYDRVHPYDISCAEGLEMALGIIDKYKAEKSEEEAYSFPEVFGEPIEMLIDGIWVKGKVINDYRSRDGIVNMETADGKKYWCGCERTDCYRRPKEGIVANGELYPGEFDDPLAAEGSEE